METIWTHNLRKKAEKYYQENKAVFKGKALGVVFERNTGIVKDFQTGDTENKVLKLLKEKYPQRDILTRPL